jgi:hypothetical protein
MSYTAETFIEEYPEFGDIPPAAVARQLRLAVLTLSRPAWGKWYEEALGLWAAHFLAREYDVAAKCKEFGKRDPYDLGSANSMSASTSSLSLSKAVSAMVTSDDPRTAEMALTRYGEQYLYLLETVIAPCVVVYSPDTSATLGGR